MNLNQIAQDFYVTEIQGMHFLFQRHSGNVSSINESGVLLIKMAQAGLSDQQITDELSQVLDISQKQILQDIDSLCLSLSSSIDIPEEDHPEAGHMPAEEFIGEPADDSQRVCCYRVGGTRFRVQYPDADGQQHCHAILSAMATNDSEQADFSIKLSEGQNGWAVFVDEVIRYAVTEHTLMADILRTAMLDAIGSKMTNWASLHAAAISGSQGNALLLAAPSGSGKSTLCVELVSRGLSYLGDDTQILDLDNRTIWPFPTSANLKQGSWSFFQDTHPSLAGIEVFRPDSRPVKFLPLEVDIDQINQPFSTQALVFPEYDANHSGQITSLSLHERIALLSESGCYSRVEASAEMSQKYMEYILSIDAYRMLYASTEQAIELLTSKNLISDSVRPGEQALTE